VLQFQTIPFSVNFDGEPGTGKTTFGSYIVNTGIFSRIYIYNLVQAGKLDFQETIMSLERQIHNSSPKDRKEDGGVEIVLLILDEIDKWLESYISHQIHTYRDEARKETKKDSTSGGPVLIESYAKLTEKEEDEKRIQLKNEFLDQLYKLVDGHTLPDIRKYVIIFNTNNFDRLFKNVDQRYDALKDRFQEYKFKKNGKKEIITYIKGIRDKVKEYCDDSSIPEEKRMLFKTTASEFIAYDESIFDEIPDNIEVSYRTISKFLRKNCFNIADTIQDLSDQDNTENSSNLTSIINTNAIIEV